MASSQAVRDYYDHFVHRVLKQDFVQPNLRQLLAIDLIRRHLKPGNRVLEVGCGAGIITREIAAMGCEVTAADIGPKNADLTRAVCSGLPVSVVLWDVTADAIPEGVRGPFDAVVLADVVEHIPSEVRATVLSRIASLLTHGGKMILTFPSVEYQKHLRLNDPDGLQIVDEDVDPFAVAGETGLLIKHLAWVDAWMTNQYNHLVLEAHSARVVERLPGNAAAGRIGSLLWRLRGMRVTRAIDAWSEGHPLRSIGQGRGDWLLSRLFWLYVATKWGRNHSP